MIIVCSIFVRVDASGVDVCDIADDVINTIDISEAIDMLGESNVISHISWDVVKEHFDAEIKLELMELMSQVASDD